MKAFITALRFLTILPFPQRSDDDTAVFGRSTAFFPVVGWIIGFFLYLVGYIHLKFYPSANIEIITFLIIFLEIVITGALHIDGVGDFCDGIFSPAKDRFRRLEIMRDSRLGTFGILGILGVLCLKFILIKSLIVSSNIVYLLAAPLFARWSIVVFMFSSPNAREEDTGLSGLYIGHIARLHLVEATIFTSGVGFFLFGWYVLKILFILLLSCIVMRLYCQHKLCGITGDAIGMYNEICEIIILFLGFIYS